MARVGVRVHNGTAYGPILDHLALLVTGDDGVEWLVDVGFGNHSTYPLKVSERGAQKDPGGLFRIADSPLGDLLVRTEESRTETMLQSDAELLAAYRDHFGVVIDRAVS